MESSLPEDATVVLGDSSSRNRPTSNDGPATSSSLSIAAGSVKEEDHCDVPNWPTEPSVLPEPSTIWATAAGWVFEILLMTLPIVSILVLSTLAKLYDGRSVDLYPFGQQIIQATTIVLHLLHLYLTIGRNDLLDAVFRLN